MKLTVELAQEGMTRQLLDSINLKRECSPVMLDPESLELFHAHPFSKGYWVSQNMQILKDENRSSKVFTANEILIARARFLLHYPDGLPKPEPINETPQDDFLMPQPMYTARFDNPEEMEVLKKVYSPDALKKADFNIDKIKENLKRETNK